MKEGKTAKRRRMKGKNEKDCKEKGGICWCVQLKLPWNILSCILSVIVVNFVFYVDSSQPFLPRSFRIESLGDSHILE